MKNNKYKSGKLRVITNREGIQHLCLPDGTHIPGQIDSLCRQSLEFSKRGECEFIVRLYRKIEGKICLSDAPILEKDHDFGEYNWPAIIVNETAYAIDGIIEIPEDLDQVPIAIIQVTASLDSSEK